MTDLESWFDTFWQTYPADLCHKKKGSKKNAFKIIEKLAPDKAMQDKILGNLRELIRFYRLERKAEGKTDRWPHATTWLNSESWRNVEDLGSYTDLNEKIDSRKCKCGGNTEHLDQCWSCYEEKHPNPHDAILKDELRKNGLWKRDSEAVRDWQARCREHLLQKGGLGGAIAQRAQVHAGTE